MRYISKQKLIDIKEELEKLSLSLQNQKDEDNKQGGPMDSFKESAVNSINIQAKESKVNELSKILKESVVLPEYVEGESIIIGKYFTIKNDLSIKKYRLVDPIEADPSKMLISALSPLGQKVTGQHKGKIFELNGQRLFIFNVE